MAPARPRPARSASSRPGGPAPRRSPSRRKPRRAYHHGDLRRALVDEALETIGRAGVEALTLRAIGQSLGVSRTALYRHFSDKSALLAAVAREGFRLFREALESARGSAADWPSGFAAMGRAYVRFAREKPSHYRVMFGGFLDACARDADLAREADAAFRTLVDAIGDGQRLGFVRPDDGRAVAVFVWATVHGLALLAIDGQIPPDQVEVAIDYGLGRLAPAIAPGPARA